MQFLSMVTETDAADPLEAVLHGMSYGGVVDPDTAAAESVVLWTDPESVVAIRRAAEMERRRPPGRRVA